MQLINLSIAKISELRHYVSEHNIEVLGNKSLKASFITAIESFQAAAAIVKTEGIELKEFYTSPEAQEFYGAAIEFSRQALVIVLTSIVSLVLILSIALQWTRKTGRKTGLSIRAAWNTDTAKRARRGINRRLKDWTEKLNGLGEDLGDWISVEVATIVILAETRGDWIK